MRNDLFSTLIKVSQEVKKRDIPGVYGLLIDLIEIPEEFRICSDIGVGNKLFSFVVDNDDTAKILVDINKELQGASFSIFPLNWQKKGFNHRYPQQDENSLIVRDFIKVLPDYDLP